MKTHKGDAVNNYMEWIVRIMDFHFSGKLRVKRIGPFTLHLEFDKDGLVLPYITVEMGPSVVTVGPDQREPNRVYISLITNRLARHPERKDFGPYDLKDCPDTLDYKFCKSVHYAHSLYWPDRDQAGLVVDYAELLESTALVLPFTVDGLEENGRVVDSVIVGLEPRSRFAKVNIEWHTAKDQNKRLSVLRVEPKVEKVSL